MNSQSQITRKSRRYLISPSISSTLRLYLQINVLLRWRIPQCAPLLTSTKRKAHCRRRRLLLGAWTLSPGRYRRDGGMGEKGDMTRRRDAAANKNNEGFLRSAYRRKILIKDYLFYWTTEIRPQPTRCQQWGPPVFIAVIARSYTFFLLLKESRIEGFIVIRARVNWRKWRFSRNSMEFTFL